MCPPFRVNLGPVTCCHRPMTVTANPSRPEPVLNAAAIASLLTTLTGLTLTALAATHVLTPAGSATLGPVLAAAIPTVIGAASTLVAAFRARAKVTPLTDPRVLTAAGDLISVGQAVAIAARQAARAAGPQTPGVADHAAPEPVPVP
jgi:hypothetical protein